MKTTYLFIFLLFAGIITTYAQSFQKGTKIISAGIGLGSGLNAYSGADATPGISANYEQGIWDAGPGIVSLGGYAGRIGFKYEGSSAGYEWEQKWNYTVVGARAAWHYNGLNNDKFDVYGGVMLSYNILNYKYEDNDNSYNYDGENYGSGIGLTGYIGGRYNFSENFSVYSEIGYGVSFLTLGLSYRL